MISREDLTLNGDEIKKRKKRFGAFLLALILTVLPVAAVLAFEVDQDDPYNPRFMFDGGDQAVPLGARVNVGDNITLSGNGGAGYSIVYITPGGNDDDQVPDNSNYVVRSVGGAQSYQFAGLSGGSGVVTIITLRNTGEDKKEGEEEEEEDRTPLNPDALDAHFFDRGSNRLNDRVKIGKQEQGPAAKAVFSAACPRGWKEAFAMTLSKDDKQTNDKKDGIFRLYVPNAFQKAGRKYAILALDRYGNVRLLSDADSIPNVVTADLVFEGYALELIYKD
ncbi:MAG: hypothetical protein K5886_06090 [Lachnospiraceae bacterium]|nr:hypothetical protein [Lachnospiraceae bacterium]